MSTSISSAAGAFRVLYLYDNYEVTMNYSKLLSLAGKPELYQPGTAFMWSDDHISNQLLGVHLSQDIDLASRKESTIEDTLAWIQQKVPGQGLEILDLGCGPGLYTSKLAAQGHNVTGVDLSPASLAYARKTAEEKQLPIRYLHQDYLELSDENRYDLVMMIFTDFGVLLPEQRVQLLAKIYRALKPGGIFLFDALNHKYSFAVQQGKNWELASEGFWKDRPYLALSELFVYEEQNLGLSQHIVIAEDGTFDIYRFWTHTFSDEDLLTACRNSGFKEASCHHNILPDSEMCSSESVTFCLAVK